MLQDRIAINANIFKRSSRDAQLPVRPHAESVARSIRMPRRLQMVSQRVEYLSIQVEVAKTLSRSDSQEAWTIRYGQPIVDR